MDLSAAELVYVCVVLGAGAYALMRTLTLLGVTRRLRIRGVEKRKRFESVRTQSPVEDPKTVALERGIESIERHFSVLRRLLVPLIVLFTVLMVAPAFLASASATMASMIGAVIAAIFGLALRPYLENAVGGLVISSSGLVRIGDTVRIDDWYGTIEDITTTHTTIKLWDWRRYLVPNSRMLQSTFFNYSLFDTYQWAYVEFWVAPDVDLDEVREIALRSPCASPHFSGREEPRFWIINIEKDAICCWVAAWADTPSGAWSLTHDTRTELLRELRRRGIPLSQQRHVWTAEAPGQPGGVRGSAAFPPRSRSRRRSRWRRAAVELVKPRSPLGRRPVRGQAGRNPEPSPNPRIAVPGDPRQPNPNHSTRCSPVTPRTEPSRSSLDALPSGTGSPPSPPGRP
jgi:hypothetical protein